MDEAAQTAASERVASITPAAGEVRVWRWSLLCNPRELDARRRSLTQQERARADRLVSEKLTRRFVAARAGLRRVLGGLLGVAPEDVSFAYGPAGKPRLAPGAAPEALSFNLTHSGDAALLAVAAEPVGADLEPPRPMPRAAAFAERWYHPEERRRLDAAPEADRLAAFFRVWTAKEAALKLLGRGVGEALPEILTPAGDGWATDLPESELRLTRCWITRLDNGAAAIATRAAPAAISSFELEPV